MQHAARPELLLKARILRIVLVLRVLLGVEVVKIAVDLGSSSGRANRRHGSISRTTPTARRG
jgi:hypothetical protein